MQLLYEEKKFAEIIVHFLTAHTVYFKGTLS
jgi:hypothetical protein